MPRLLLVDDNPSIHKIAETLLGSSSIELYCVGSASEALMLLDSGERFDVALLDTAMPGMDGWELLARMRKHPDSAFIPIAMMAGVLDTVDPEQLKRAPIQGFIKKPIELRELADRVQHLLATPVTLTEPEGGEEEPSVLSPFATVPGTKIKSLPEFRGPEDEGLRLEHPLGGSAEFEDADHGDDLLLLTPEDFWFEEAPMELDSQDYQLARATAEAMAEAEKTPPMPLMSGVDATLDLEELDLEALKDLPSEEIPTLPETPAVPEMSPVQHAMEPADELFEEAPEPPVPHAEPALAPEAKAAPAEPFEEETLAIPGLAIRAQALSMPEHAAVGFPMHEFLTEDIPAHELSESREAPDLAYLASESRPEEASAPSEIEEPSAQGGLPEESTFAAFALPAAAPPPLPTTDAVAAPSPLAGPPSGEMPHDAAALVQILMSDPVLMDALAKAVVARLGDQALREIAWELMPELAEKLPR